MDASDPIKPHKALVPRGPSADDGLGKLGAHSKADRATAGEALCAAQQERRARCGGVVRGGEPAADADVPVKTAEQQASLMLLGIRDQLVGRRTQLSNTIRGHAAEFGLIEAKGLDKLGSFLAAIAARRKRAGAGPRAVCDACLRIRPGAGRTEGDRGQASGLAPRQCLEPAPGADPGCWSSHGRSAGDEGARSTGLPLRPAVCGLARPNTKKTIPPPERPGSARSPAQAMRDCASCLWWGRPRWSSKRKRKVVGRAGSSSS